MFGRANKVRLSNCFIYQEINLYYDVKLHKLYINIFCLPISYLCVLFIYLFSLGNGTDGRWDTTGCKFLSQTKEGVVSCQCTHLTNFALLLDVYQTVSNPLSLQVVTWIGCAISLVGLALTIFIFSYFR